MSTNETKTTLTELELENLQVAFAAMNPLEFARHLQTIDMPNVARGEWLRRKIEQRPTEREEIMCAAIEQAMTKFWHRLSTPNGEV